MLQRILFLGFILMLFSSSAMMADGFKFRKYAGEFMEIGVDARAQSMGGAFTAMSGDIASTYYNPAGLFRMKNTQISFMHTQQMLVSVNYDYLAAGRRQGASRVFAVSLIRLGIDNIKDSRQALDNRDPDNWRIYWDKIKSFNAADYIFSVSVAQKLVRNWVIGGNIKIIRRSIVEHNANGIGFDIGLQKNWWNNLTLGANLRNATTTLIAWDTGEKELVKPVFYLGGSYRLNIAALNSRLQPALDVILRNENRQESATVNAGPVSMDFAAGLEYAYREVFFIRAGRDEIGRFNLGAGIQIPHVRIDYAFAKYDTELGNSQRVGLLVSF